MSDANPKFPQNLPPSVHQPVPPDLGPYLPPKDFDHGEEFESNVPRPIPGFLKSGSYAKRRNGNIYTLFVLGLMCIVFWPIPFVQDLSLYILPLQYLHWIGLGFIAIAAFQFLAGMVTSGRYKYIKEGTPFVGRVTLIHYLVAGTAEAPQFKYAATVEFDHPDTDKHVEDVVLAGPDFWNMGEIEKHKCTLTPGDYVTLVALPGKIDKTVQLYGFLGLDPDQEFLLKNGKPIQGVSPYSAVMIAFLISAIIVLVMLAFDVLMFSFPTGGDWKVPLAVALAGFVGGGLLGVFLSSRNQSGEQVSGSKVGEFIGIGFLGAIATTLLLFVLNARLDNGPSQLKPITIVNFWQTTHNFIIRDYEVEYRLLGAADTEKRHVRFSQLDRLGNSEFGVIEEKPGRFGFPWISGVHPVIWLPFEDVPNIDGSKYRITYKMFTEGEPEKEIAVEYVAKPVIELDNDKYAPLPEVLLEKALASLRQQAVSVEKE